MIFENYENTFIPIDPFDRLPPKDGTGTMTFDHSTSSWLRLTFFFKIQDL